MDDARDDQVGITHPALRFEPELFAAAHPEVVRPGWAGGPRVIVSVGEDGSDSSTLDACQAAFPWLAVPAGCVAVPSSLWVGVVPSRVAELLESLARQWPDGDVDAVTLGCGPDGRLAHPDLVALEDRHVLYLCSRALADQRWRTTGELVAVADRVAQLSARYEIPLFLVASWVRNYETVDLDELEVLAHAAYGPPATSRR